MFNVIEPGLHTTFQDGGRKGYQRFGIPPGGAMDMFALRVANLLCGNDQYEAALELTALGPKLETLNTATIALTGANLSAMTGDRPLLMWRTVEVGRGEVISFRKRITGCRAYLAVAGGFAGVPAVLGSRSTFPRGGAEGLAGRRVQAGDVLQGRSLDRKVAFRVLPPVLVPDYPKELVLNAVPGPEANLFSPQAMEAFFSTAYIVAGESDRMGCRLDGPPVKLQVKCEPISDAMPLGTIQVPPDGKPIVMMADRPTTGGYPKIAVLTTADTCRLAQAAPGTAVRFRKVPVEEAVQLLRSHEAGLTQIAQTLAKAR
ncbi:MAG: biotin-dependent carboxyltransferase family protein [Planctomycetota bacterium]|nr:biotin-dependent carboxyltransferase family protein [Planctomycetota bacterium]